MPIPLRSLGEEQKCCFCFISTKSWTDIVQRPAHKQVPCCKDCGEIFFGIDVPSRRYYSVILENIKRESARAFSAGRKSMAQPERPKKPAIPKEKTVAQKKKGRPERKAGQQTRKVHKKPGSKKSQTEDAATA